MTDITLSAAVRSTLLSLQGTSTLIDRTQNRLSTGLRVANAKDDPVSFFQAKTLDDRALVFTEKKDGIDQGISALSTALEGVAAIENIVRQLKGLVSSLKSANGTQFTDLINQYNSLRTQIGSIADDTTYQGINLINSTTESLTVSFSDQTQSLLTVKAVNVSESGLILNPSRARRLLCPRCPRKYRSFRESFPGGDFSRSGDSPCQTLFASTPSCPERTAMHREPLERNSPGNSRSFLDPVPETPDRRS